MVPRRRHKTMELPALDAEIERLSLAEHVRELDDQGLCVVPPERTGFGPDFVERGRKALLTVAEKRTGARFDLALGCLDELEDPAGRIGQFLLTHLIYVGQEDGPEAGRVFEEIAVNPVKKAFFRHLLGDVHRMSTSNGWVKFRTPERHQGPFTTPLHADTGAPTPWPARTPHVSNMNWLLTDTAARTGGLLRPRVTARRAPLPPRRRVGRPRERPRAPGRSSTCAWHGAFRKETPGLRLSIHGLHCRPHYIPQQDYRGNVAPETYARSGDPDYLRMLTRADDPWLQPRIGGTFAIPKVKSAGPG